MGRSRSPRRKAEWNNWISRQIASFGRHPQKRPKGLNVDQNGNIRVDQLMSLWGRKEGLKEQDVLEAVQDNMFHEDGNLRFSIDHDFAGALKIRVMPKRNKWESSTWNTPTWKGTAQQRAASWADRQTPEKRAPVMKGSVAKGKAAAPAPKVVAAPKINTYQKLDMPLDAIITNEKDKVAVAGADSTMSSGGAHQAAVRTANNAKTYNAQRAFGQMGFTSDTPDLRLPPRSTAHQGAWGGRKNRVKEAWGNQKTHASQRDESPRRHRSRSPASDDELAASCQKSLSVDDRPLASSGTSLADAAGAKGKPSPPPGEGWTKYEDEGTLWYHYQGPLGQWWCQADSSDVQPYEDD